MVAFAPSKGRKVDGCAMPLAASWLNLKERNGTDQHCRAVGTWWSGAMARGGGTERIAHCSDLD
jgi:hypothetical protein